MRRMMLFSRIQRNIGALYFDRRSITIFQPYLFSLMTCESPAMGFQCSFNRMIYVVLSFPATADLQSISFQSLSYYYRDKLKD